MTFPHCGLVYLCPVTLTCWDSWCVPLLLLQTPEDRMGGARLESPEKWVCLLSSGVRVTEEAVGSGRQGRQVEVWSGSGAHRRKWQACRQGWEQPQSPLPRLRLFLLVQWLCVEGTMDSL